MSHVRVAICNAPRLGGAHRWFLTLRSGLPMHDIEVVGACVGGHNEAWSDDVDTDGYVRVSPSTTGVVQSAQAFVDWVRREGIDIVVPMASPSVHVAIRHLPPYVHVVNRCYSTGSHAYRVALYGAPRLTRVVGTSPRQIRELTTLGQISDDRIQLIPHGVDVDRFYPAPVERKSGPLRLLYLGRLANASKGVFLLPRLVSALRSRAVAHTLVIAGSGPDEVELRRRLAREVDRGVVRMLGTLDSGAVAAVLRDSDVLVMPSNYEGFGISLIEALATSVVPVVTRVMGVTDWIVDDGKTGFLFPRGDVAAMARAVTSLAENRGRLGTMGAAGRDAAEARFSAARTVAEYGALFHEVASGPPPPNAEPWPWSRATPNPALQPRWYHRLPRSWLHLARAMLRR